MKIVNCKDEPEWIAAINQWLKDKEKLAGIEPLRIFLPAGETPRPLYGQWQNHGAPFSSRCVLVQVDDVITGKHRFLFREFFKSELSKFQTRFEWIDSAEKGGHLALLGLGPNGHVAFHEPRLPKNFYSGCVQLEEETCRRLDLQPGTYGITYGLQAFTLCQAVALLVRGEKKNSILKQIQKADCQLPAAELLRKCEVTVFYCP